MGTTNIDATNDGASQGVSEGEDNTTGIERNAANGRDDALDRIAKQVESEAGEFAEPEENPEEELRNVEPPVFLQDDVWMTTVKVDGEEKAVPFDSMTADYQKYESGSRRLTEASMLERKINEDREVLNRDRAEFDQLRNSNEPSTDAQGRQPPSEDAVDAKRLTDAVYSGDEEETEKAFREFAEGLQGGDASLDRDSIVSDAVQRIRAEDFELSRAADVERIELEHKDMFKDPMLRTLIDQKSEELIGSEPGLSVYDNLSKSVEFIKEWKGGSNDGMSDRRSRKDNLDYDPPSAGATTNVGQDEPKAPSRSSVIADMRTSRGQGY